MMIEVLQARMNDVVITDVIIGDDEVLKLDADRFDALGVVDGQVCAMSYNSKRYKLSIQRGSSGGDSACLISDVVGPIVVGCWANIKFNAIMSIESAREYEPIIIDCDEG